jgi:hypothetical protein
MGTDKKEKPRKTRKRRDAEPSPIDGIGILTHNELDAETANIAAETSSCEEGSNWSF